MKTPFKDIGARLEDPFFELSHLGKHALKQVIIPGRSLPEIPANFRISEWLPEDDQFPISYVFTDSRIGRLFIATTPKGICYLGFENNDPGFCLEDLARRFPKQSLVEETGSFQQQAIAFCNGSPETEIKLYLKGTPFQLGIWKKLLQIPEGRLTTYAALGGDVKAARAVGTAVGDNPVSYIIPCHRVIRSDGSFHGYFWGTGLKRRLLAFELQRN